MVFDAKAAGAPNDVIDYLVSHPDEASRIAIEVLKTAEPGMDRASLAKAVVDAAQGERPGANTNDSQQTKIRKCLNFQVFP
jgi:hypothetical protein